MPSALSLDRLTPTLRPNGKPSGYQRWRELLFVHYTYPLDVVRRLVPAPLELDPWDGLGFVGAVPFRMKDIRPSWLPLGIDFLETNLRTYVHYRGEPGVYFFSLEASSWLAVQAARYGWGLPYFYATMESTRDGRRIDYRTTRRSGEASAHFDFTFDAAAAPATPGTLEHFLLERYVLFTVHAGRVVRGLVHHTPYPVARAELHASSTSLLGAAGLPDATPALAHYAAGVDVEVFGPSAV